MKELVCEVHERFHCLLLAVFCIVESVLLMVLSRLGTGDDSKARWAMFLLGLFILCAAGHMILAFLNHRLKVFSDGSMQYSTFLSKKIEFSYTDIAEIEQREFKKKLSLILRDINGKCFGNVRSNMVGYEEFGRWLNEQRQKAKNAVVEGDTDTHQVVVTPVNGKVFFADYRVKLVGIGVFFIIMDLIAFSLLLDSLQNQETELISFDAYKSSEEKQTLVFDSITYQFANVELSDTHGMYFVFDPEMNIYIVCMDKKLLETEYADNYAYTFGDTVEYPGIAEIEGYAIEISAELRANAIECLNTILGSEIFTTSNFEDYVGRYYLDATYQPEESDSPVKYFIWTIVFMVAGVGFIYLGVHQLRMPEKEPKQDEIMIVLPKDINAEALESTCEIEETREIEKTEEISAPRNIVIALLASIVCALSGGFYWIIFYKFGEIVGLSGIVAVVGAIFGYCKIGRRKLTIPVVVWCVLVSLLSIGFANYLVYAWKIVDVINASNPGRTNLGNVLKRMPELMDEMALWSDFFDELSIGMVLSLFAAVSSLFNKMQFLQGIQISVRQWLRR